MAGAYLLIAVAAPVAGMVAAIVTTLLHIGHPGMAFFNVAQAGIALGVLGWLGYHQEVPPSGTPSKIVRLRSAT